MNIWQRYFYKQFIYTILFILFCIYGLYILVDIMAHLKAVTDSKSSFVAWIEYYLATFSKRLDILLPFSLLIASIRTLLTFQLRGELVAMLASGISKQELLKPFLIVAASCSLLLYANYEWVFPAAVSKIAIIQETRFGKDDLEERIEAPKEVMLNDGTKLIYGVYKRKTKEFENVFWICSADNIYHMKTLSVLPDSPPKGLYVDHIERSKEGLLEVIASHETEEFPSMHFDKAALKYSVIPPSEQSLFELLYQSWLYLGSSSSKAAEIKSYFFFRLSIPLLCILTFVATAPFCMRFSRHMPILMIYLVAVAALFCTSLLFQAALSLGKNQLIPSYLTQTIPWAFLGYFFGKRYVTL
jgi:lipopolysaccharide export system permease protein